MKKLKFFPTTDVKELAWPDEMESVSLATPALKFLTDFHTTNPLVIESSISAIEVKKIMEKAHVRLLIVIDEENRFLGVIGADDLLDRKIVQRISEGYRRGDILVTDMMRPAKELIALDYTELASATIGDVVAALKESGQQHCLVLDRADNKIRGVYSAADISRKLHLQIDIRDKSSFYKVFATMA